MWHYQLIFSFIIIWDAFTSYKLVGLYVDTLGAGTDTNWEAATYDWGVCQNRRVRCIYWGCAGTCVSENMFVSWKSSFFHYLSIDMFVMVDVIDVYVSRVQSLLRNGYADLGRHCRWRRNPIEGRARSSRLSSILPPRRQGYVPSWGLAWIHCLPLSHPPLAWNPTTLLDMTHGMGLLHRHPIHCLPFFKLHLHFLICVYTNFATQFVASFVVSFVLCNRLFKYCICGCIVCMFFNFVCMFLIYEINITVCASVYQENENRLPC